MQIATTSSTRMTVVAVLWFLIITVGMSSLWLYANTPGPTASPGPMWPAASGLTRDAAQPSLIMFAHPRCPCSRASIGELAVLMAKTAGRARAQVVFYKPADAPAGWERTDLWESADAIPGVRVSSDPDGAEAKRFDAAVSGQTLLYEADGRLVFTGGITSARGHSGDNAGRLSVESWLRTGHLPAPATRVFGCFLRPAAS
jgi:hypothetical protein